MSATLPTELRELIESGPLTYLSTTSADGSPHVTMMWIGLDDEGVFSTHMRENVKLRNMKRDPRVALSFAPAPVPGDWISPHVVLYATATVVQSDRAGEMMAGLAPAYVGSEVDLSGQSGAGFVVRYAIDRISGIGPWTNG